MIVTISEYTAQAIDGYRNVVQRTGSSGLRLASQILTATGDALPLQLGTTLIRVATDTAILIDPSGAQDAATLGDLVPANTVEWFQVHGGTTLQIAAG